MKKIYIHHHSTLSSNIFVFFAMTNYRLNLILTILPCTTLELCPFYYFQFCHLLHWSYVPWLFSILPFTTVIIFSILPFTTLELCPLIIFSILPFNTLELCPFDYFLNFGIYYTGVMSHFQFCLFREFHWNDIFLY